MLGRVSMIWAPLRATGGPVGSGRDACVIIRQDVGARRMPAGLIVLALGCFGIGLTEFVIVGLLPR